MATKLFAHPSTEQSAITGNMMWYDEKNFASPIKCDGKCFTTLFLSRSEEFLGTTIQYASPCKFSEKSENTKEQLGLDNEYIIPICELQLLKSDSNSFHNGYMSYLFRPFQTVTMV